VQALHGDFVLTNCLRLNCKANAMPISYGIPQGVRCDGAWIPLRPIGNRTGGLSLILRGLWGSLKHDRKRVERLGEGIIYARLSNYDPNDTRIGRAENPGTACLSSICATTTAVLRVMGSRSSKAGSTKDEWCH